MFDLLANIKNRIAVHRKFLARRAHVKRVMAGIECACEQGIFAKKVSRTFGLRALRDFEEINGGLFDPNSISHTMTLSGKARDRYFLHLSRKFYKIQKDVCEFQIASIQNLKYMVANHV